MSCVILIRCLLWASSLYFMLRNALLFIVRFLREVPNVYWFCVQFHFQTVAFYFYFLTSWDNYIYFYSVHFFCTLVVSDFELRCVMLCESRIILFCLVIYGLTVALLGAGFRITLLRFFRNVKSKSKSKYLHSV